jgi:hypothetical protein
VGIPESDDYVAPSMFERSYNVVKSNNLDFIKYDFSRFHRVNGIETNELVEICGTNPS